MTAPQGRERLEALLQRVEAAEGPDRDLDADIVLWRHPELAEWPRSDRGGWVSPEWGLISPPEHFTASVDAALALVERVLPDVERIDVIAFPNLVHRGRAEVWLDGDTRVVANAKTPALALIAALLRALIASTPTPGETND